MLDKGLFSEVKSGVFKTYHGFWTRDSVEADTDHYYLFGDNENGYGGAGQAVIRGLPNAFGIPTKKSPGMSEADFWSDDEYERNCRVIDAALSRVPTDRDVYVSEHGLGTGLAELDKRAPRTFEYLCKVIGPIPGQ